jgi:hypothetical protein
MFRFHETSEPVGARIKVSGVWQPQAGSTIVPEKHTGAVSVAAVTPLVMRGAIPTRFVMLSLSLVSFSALRCSG